MWTLFKSAVKAPLLIDTLGVVTSMHHLCGAQLRLNACCKTRNCVAVHPKTTPEIALRLRAQCDHPLGNARTERFRLASLRSDGRLVDLPAAEVRGSVFNSSLLVAGATVGAGILALPAVTEGAGFVASSATLVACSIFSTITGLLLVEVNIHLARSSVDKDASVSMVTMAGRTLGSGGAALTTAAYIFLQYALLVAYISKGGELLADAAGVPLWVTAPLFCGVLSSGCYFASPRTADKINSALVLTFIGSFVALVVVVSHKMVPSLLAKADWDEVPGTLPVVALAFVYQNIVPVISRNLGYDIGKVRTSILGGVALSLGMFLSWEAAILGIPPSSCQGLPADAVRACAAAGAAAEGIASDPLRLLQEGTGMEATLLGLFSFFAVTTSYIAFVLGLTDFLADALKLKGGPRQPLTYALTSLPPLALALLFPDVFYAALDTAGTYGVMTLFGLLPVAMAWQLRYNAGAAGHLLAAGGVAEAGKAAAAGRRWRASAEDGYGAAQGSNDEGGGFNASRVGPAVQVVPGGKATLVGVAIAAGGVIVNALAASFFMPTI